ncbi:MAG: class I SAM-dependent methyltransferase [Thermodesulfobacteriota bacterium]
MPENAFIKESVNSAPGDEYQRFAGIYDGLLRLPTRGIRLAGLRMLPPREGSRVLDVGCGTGIHLNLYRQFGCRLYGLDTSKSMLKVAGKRLGSDADLRFHNAAEMPYENSMFDLVSGMFVLHEMDQSARKAVVSEMERVVKPGGGVLLIDFNAGIQHTLAGRFASLMIPMVEKAAGARHFNNYKHFMSINGLASVVEASGLVKTGQKFAAGGAVELLSLARHSAGQ